MRNMQALKGSMGGFALMFAASLLLLLPGCRGPFGPQDTRPGTGTVSLTIGQLDMSRAIQPDIGLEDFDNFSIVFSRDGVSQSVNYVRSAENVTAQATLALGYWDLTVNAYLGGNVAATNTVEVYVEAGFTGLNVDLLPIREDVEGTFTWRIDFPEGTAGTVVVRYVNAAGEIAAPVTGAGASIPSDADDYWEGSLELYAGRYFAFFRLTHNALGVATLGKDLHIYGNMESRFTHDFAEAHFRPAALATLGDFINLVDMPDQNWQADVITVGPVDVGGGQPLLDSGNPTLAWIDVDGNIALSMTDRANGWYGLDLRIGELGFTGTGVYQMTVTGTGALALSSNPHDAAGWAVSATLTGPATALTLTTSRFTEANLGAATAIRIQGTAGTDIVITGISFARVDEICDSCGQYPCVCGPCGLPPGECDCVPPGYLARLPGSAGNLNAVRTANAGNIAWDMRDLDDEGLAAHFAGLGNRMVNFTYHFGQPIVVSTNAGSGPGGNENTHDSMNGGWAALTVIRPNMGLGMNYVLHITGRVGNNGEAIGGNPGQMGLRFGATWPAMISTPANALPTTFTIAHPLTADQAGGPIEIRWNLWNLNPLPASFAISIDDMVIVSVEAADYEVARADLLAVINTANLRVLGGYTSATWIPFAAALAAANTAMAYTNVDAIEAARTSLSTTLTALVIDANPAWAAVLASPYVAAVTGGAAAWNYVTSVADGLLVHNRGANNQGFGVDIVGLRTAYPGTAPVITVTGRMSTQNAMMLQGFPGNIQGAVTEPQGTFTVTIPGTGDVLIPPWASAWTSTPWITNADGIFGDFLVTGIQVGTLSIQELLDGDDPSVDRTLLETAISNATGVLDTAVVNTAAANVPPTQQWVTQAVRDALFDAIGVAQGVLGNADATQAMVDNAVTTLNTARTIFEGLRQPGAPLDEGRLETAISAANALLDETVPSTDGTGVTYGYWAPQAVIDAFEGAVTTAGTALTAATTRADIDAALSALAAAKTIFTGARTAGVLPDGTITIGIRDFNDAAGDIIVVPDDLSRSGPISLTLTQEVMDDLGIDEDYVWWIWDNAHHAGASVTFPAYTFAPGQASVTLVIQVGQVHYSRTITFRVVN